MRIAALRPLTASPRTRRALSLLGVALVCALLGNLVHSVLEALHGGGEDYLSFASAGRLVRAGSHCLYCSDALAQQQANLLGYWPAHPLNFPNAYVNPPLFAFVMQPIAVLPLGTGLGLWVCLLLLALGVSVVATIRLLRAAPLGYGRALLAVTLVFSAPAASGVLLGQVDPLLLVPALGSLALFRRGHPASAGLVLAVVLVKPQLVWLVLPVLAAAGMWRMIGGFVAGGVVWLATAPLLLGTDHLTDILGALSSSDQQRQLGEARSLPGVLGLFQLSGRPVLAFTLIAGLAVMICAWWTRARWRANPEMALGVGILASLGTAPHLFSHDYILLAIPLVAWAARRPWPAVVAAVAMNGAYLVDVSIPLRFAHLQALVVTAIGLAMWADVTGGPAMVARLMRRPAAGPVAPRRQPQISARTAPAR